MNNKELASVLRDIIDYLESHTTNSSQEVYYKVGRLLASLPKPEPECIGADVPADFPVRPLKSGQKAKDRATCGNCGLSWDDSIPTSMTPAPSARCPFEYFHIYETEMEDK